MSNIANSILILGLAWFGYQHEFHFFIILGILFGLATWLRSAAVDEKAYLLEQQAQYYREKAKWYSRRKT